ncbi:MAG: LpqB family beta-propeller domain-containing protein [Candidatus Nanopelagicales bacterium]|jgi:hypothetical protein
MRLAHVAALALAIPVLGACASIPTSGPIQQGVEVGVETTNQVIRVIARPPQPDMTPSQIVSGFLQASASFEDDHAVAREYLTPAAAVTWDPASGVAVYDGVPTIVPDGVTDVDMTATLVGSIDAKGHYDVGTPGALIETTFRMEFVSGNWRIATPPQGLLLSRSDVERAFRVYDLYFLDPSFTTLVPDPRYFPVDGPTPATAITRALLDGPTEWLAPAVRTGFPDGTSLAVDAVPVVEGVARVDLDPQVRLADEDTRRAFSAQLAWSLRQAPGVRFVDLNAGGQVLDVPGAVNPQPIDSWSAFDPNAMPAGATAFGVVGGRVIDLGRTPPLPIPGGAGLGSPPLDGIAVSLLSDRVAGLDADARLWVGPVTAGSILAEAVAEPGQSRPSFGRGDAAWVVGPDGVLRRIDVDGTIVEVQVDGLQSKAELESVSISRDGTRAALTVRRGPRTFVMLAVITLREDVPRVETPVRVDNRLTTVIDVAWADDDRLVALGVEGAGAPSVFEIDLSRGQVRSLGAPPGTVRIAAAPGAPILAATQEQRVWTYTSGPWRLGPRGASPAYPGS